MARNAPGNEKNGNSMPHKTASHRGTVLLEFAKDGETQVERHETLEGALQAAMVGVIGLSCWPTCLTTGRLTLRGRALIRAIDSMLQERRKMLLAAAQIEHLPPVPWCRLWPDLVEADVRQDGWNYGIPDGDEA